MTGIILAGGRNIRMGRDKATLPWQASDFLHTIAEKLATVCNELIVVSNSPPRADLPAVRFVSDIIPFCGPLSGIHAGLTYASFPISFVTACDMPFLEPAAVSWLIEQMNGWDAAVPCNDSFMEPLFACYAKTCLPAIETLLKRNIRKTQALFELVRYKPIPANELRTFDPALRMLKNINSPEDYQAALHVIQSHSVI